MLLRTLSTCMLLLCCCAHIYTTTPSVTYNSNGNPSIHHLYVSFQAGVGASDYLKIIWGEQLYITAKSQIQVMLISYSNYLQVATVTVDGQTGSGSTTYYVTFGTVIYPNTWYEIQIYPTRTPTTTPISYVVQMYSVSSMDANAIVYDSNLALGYINLRPPLTPINTLTVVCSSSSAQATTPSTIYSYDIQITPTVTTAAGGNFTIQIYYDSMVGAHNTGTTTIDFSFMGLCQAAPTAMNAAAVIQNCKISSDLSTITFSMGSVTPGSAFRISTSVSNPSYVSVRGVSVYWVDRVSGQVQENKKVSNALSVSSLSILAPPTGRVYLFWGVDIATVDAGNTHMKNIFKAAAGNIGPYNSFNIGFSFTATSPIAGMYTVKMTLMATGVLEASIAHNLPAYTAMSVVCQYAVTMVVCTNVGAFIKTNYRYFISGKAYYSSSTGATLSNFGQVSITPVVYDSRNNLLGNAALYATLSGISVSVKTSSDFLDTSGFHNTANFKIGNTQVVSYVDDLSLSSTALAAQGFLRGTNSTVGIVPTAGTTQQLLFLMNVPAASMSTSGGANQGYTTYIYFNSQAITFESNAMTSGIDFAGYSSATGTWSIQYSSCYKGGVVCEKYSTSPPVTNTKTLVNQGSQYDFYGKYTFLCGSNYIGSPPCVSSNCATECNLFNGYGTADYTTGVVSMRQIIFNITQSSLYADSTVLDFLFVFVDGSGVKSYSLINGYTLTGAPLQNIKAAYVNYYDGGLSAYNKGVRVPMMLRVGGGVLPQESLNGTVMGIFVDDAVDASTFYTTIGTTFSVGCSTGNCVYYPNLNLLNIRNDLWLTNKAFIVYNLPPIQNEFNILIPVTPSSLHTPPKTITIAFFTTDYSIGDATQLLRTISVYRVFGPAVTASLSGSISTINSLTVGGTIPDMEMSTDNFPSSNYITTALNTTNMYSSTNNTFTAGNALSPTFGASYGAGYTISSFYYNIFASSTLSFSTPPTNTATTCTQFGYVYNEIQNPGGNVYKNGQWIYISFCPIDSTYNVAASSANIDFLNPQYPTVFTNNFPLKSVLAIGFSLASGQLASYRKETTPIATLVRTCTTSKLSQYNPSTTGTQRAAFTLSVPQIVMSQSYSGYPSFRVTFTIPSSTVASSSFTPGTICDSSISSLACTVILPVSSTSVTMQLTYTGAAQLTVTFIQLNMYAVVTGVLNAAANYVVIVTLPQLIGSDHAPFGSLYTTATTYCTCSSSFTVGLTSSGSTAALSSFTTNSNSNMVRSPFSLNFGAGSTTYRDTFYISSTFNFDFGFMGDVVQTAYNRGNLRCQIYESNAVSTRWSAFALTLPTAVLTPKTEIANPKSLVFNMTCYGGTTPSGLLSSGMGLTWMDTSTGSVMQTAPSLSVPSGALGVPSSTLSVTITQKRFRSEGSKSLYSFGLTCNQPLTASSRIYIDFHMGYSSRLDSEGYVECYTRSSSVIDDTAALFTYCTVVSPWQLLVWNNMVVGAGITFYLDVYNVDQPRVSDINSNRYIAFMVDSDSNLGNGVVAKTEILDNGNALQSVTTTKIITIQSATTTSSFIRVSQTITINFMAPDTLMFSGGNKLYVLFPVSYSQLVTRASTIPCSVTVQGQATNLATGNVFISQRILMITVSTTTQTLFTLSFTVLAPSAIPAGKLNEYHFNLFCMDSNQYYYTYYSFNDLSAAFTLKANPALIDFKWLSYGVDITDSLVHFTPVTTSVVTVQTGYYSGVLELRQGIYPANYKSPLTITLISQNSSCFSFLSAGTTSSTAFSTVLGKPALYVRIGATGLSPGLYTLQFSKSVDALYSNVPPLSLVVQNNLCSLSTNAPSYTLPFGGTTLPIVIDAISCLPLTSVNVSMTFSSNELSLNRDLSTVQLLPTSMDGKIYLVVKHTSTSTLLSAGSIVTASVLFSGVNGPYYNSITGIQFTMVSATAFSNFPSATGLSVPVVAGNTATFTMQCNAASTMYWGLGVYPSLLTSQAGDLQARIVSGLNGLVTNFTEALDAQAKVYGFNQGTTMQIITKVLYNLKSNVKYVLKYFCVNQLGYMSDSQSSTFTSSNYGAYLMKVSVTFRNALTYGQYNDLACSLAANFIVPYSRILTEAMSYCGSTPFVFYSSAAAMVGNQADSSGNYVYGFYIVPDYTQSSDPTNSNIRAALSLSAFSTQVITSTANNAQLPSLVQMQTQDIQIFTTPSLSVYPPLSGLNSIVISATITNMNGFIIIGVFNGLFNGTNMTLPTNIQIKQGQFSNAVPLLQTRMLFVSQNYNASFSFDGLTANTTYSIFYFATAEDPQITSVPTVVGVVNAQTLSVLVIDLNWGVKVMIGVIVFMLM